MRINELGCAEAVHIPDTCTLREAAEQMRDKHVGSSIVSQRGASGSRAIGMITDRDIVVSATVNGADLSSTLVGELVSPGLVMIRRDCP